MTLTPAQTKILAAGAVAFVALAVYPPWRETIPAVPARFETSTDWYLDTSHNDWVRRPYQTGRSTPGSPAIKRSIGHHFVWSFQPGNARVDWSRLALYWIIAGGITGLVFAIPERLLGVFLIAAGIFILLWHLFR